MLREMLQINKWKKEDLLRRSSFFVFSVTEVVAKSSHLDLIMTVSDRYHIFYLTPLL